MRILTFFILLVVSGTSITPQPSKKSRLPHKWIKCQRDSAGYPIYSPCNGGTPRIYIEKNYLTVYWQVDGPSKYSIQKFVADSNNKSFHFYVTLEGDTSHFSSVFDVEVKDPKRHLYLWKGDYGMRWVMTPVEYKDKFRQVDNPCPVDMKPEKQFLPVEF